MQIDRDAVIQQSVQEVYDGLFRQYVEDEKARLRAHQGRSLWRRLIDALPFTITGKRK